MKDGLATTGLQVADAWDSDGDLFVEIGGTGAYLSRREVTELLEHLQGVLSLREDERLVTIHEGPFAGTYAARRLP